MTYQQARIKFAIEQTLIWPIVLLGKIWGKIIPPACQYEYFLFFPSADIGGAPRVNIDIANCLRDKKRLIVFSKKPRNNGFMDEFKQTGADILDLSAYIDNKWYHIVNIFYRGVLTSWIHNSSKPVVLGGEGLYFYKVIPWLNKQCYTVEIAHLDTWLPYNIGLIDHIDMRVQSTAALTRTINHQYDLNNLDKTYGEKLLFIENAIDLPAYKQMKNNKLEIVFIGRGSPQKRVHLVAQIAAKANERNLPVQFSFVGDVSNVIDPGQYPFCKFYGNISDQDVMEQIYERSDVLILTSSYEGLPIVVMKMMAYGKIVLSTAVNSIPDYIHHYQNGLLIFAQDEDQIVLEGLELIEALIINPGLLSELSLRNLEKARELFDRNLFEKSYRKLLVDRIRP